MTRLQITQAWPLQYGNQELKTGDKADFDDKTAAWLLDNKRAVEVETKSTGNNGGLTPEELAAKETVRKAAIVKAIAELQAANPAEAPSCNKIKEKSGYAIKLDERDLLIAEMKNEKQE